MSSRKFIGFMAIFSFLIVGLIGVANYIVDPYQQYRLATFYPISYDSNKQRYKNGGFAKNFSYDSLILGTSMTENFLLDEVEKELDFNNTLKLSISGGSAIEQSTTLQTAINSNKNLNNVVWGLDTFIFVGEVDNLSYGEGTFPFYLYDSNRLNDYKYLFSLDTLYESWNILSNSDLNNKNRYIYEKNNMYTWQHNFEKNFTLKNVRNAWNNREDFLDIEKDKQTFNYMKNSFDSNFLEIIKSNPQIHFTIFFPPYSILTFKIFEERAQLDDVLNFKKYIYTHLLNCKNVTMYDFQIAKEITTNLNNYKDVSHYHQKINSWILQQIKENNYLVTKRNFEDNLQNLQKQSNAYDLESVGLDLK
ncbi:MAG: hypothetical protein PHF17_06440 [Arcobacteraceae bacterium]|nr:hypothetical protein [Arcobacteraceae bacterium]